MTTDSMPVLRPPVPQQVPPAEPVRRARPPARVGPAAPTESTAPPATAEPAESTAPAAPAAPPAPPAPAVPAAPASAGEAPSLDDLAANLRPAISGAPGGAPDPDEVAAALEDAGLTDQSARQSFGQPDLFALARRLLPRLALAQRPRRHAVAPLRLDWSGLLRPRLAPARLVAAGGLVAAAWWLRVPPAAVLPAAAAVPLAELLLAWQLGYARWGLGYHDSGTGWRRHLRRTGLLTLAALTLPLLLAAGFAGAATRLTGLVPVATGLLASGGYPLLLLLSARRRFLSGASLIAVTAAGTALTHPSLPRMCLLAGGYLAGLALTAYAILDPRSRD